MVERARRPGTRLPEFIDSDLTRAEIYDEFAETVVTWPPMRGEAGVASLY
jgi:hypothetical protein